MAVLDRLQMATAQKSDGPHMRGLGCPDAMGRVFDHQAMFWPNTQECRGMQEEIRSRFATIHIFGAENAVEPWL